MLKSVYEIKVNGLEYLFKPLRHYKTMDNNEIISWLLNSDPAIRWQVMKDIQCDEESLYNKERQKLIKKAGAQTCSTYRVKNGLWNNSLYNGKWVSTTYTLYLLKYLACLLTMIRRLQHVMNWLRRVYMNNRRFVFQVVRDFQDLGVTGMILSMCCYFGYDNDSIHNIDGYLVSQQCIEATGCPMPIKHLQGTRLKQPWLSWRLAAI